MITTISKNELAKRWDNLSQPLREALWSEYNADVLWDICKKEHLSEEKTALVATLAGDVIMGFLLPEDFGKEIAENTKINREIADRIAAEVEKKIFRPVINEIKEIYSPPTEKEKTEVDSVVKIKDKAEETKRTIPLEALGEREPVTTNIKIEKPPTAEQTETAPFVIHQEETRKSATGDKKFKGLDFPFGFFGGEERRSGASEPVRVEIETPGTETKRVPFVPAREGERVVHYSEYRTPLTPFGKPEDEIINFQNLTKREPPTGDLRQVTDESRQTAKTEPENKAPEPKKTELPQQRTQEIKSPKPKEENGPSIEGNIIDLKNL
jgi:hypothetical protein